MSRRNKKGENTSFRRLRNVLLSLIFVCIMVCAGVGAGMYAAISAEIKDMNIQNLAFNHSSFLFYNDAEGNSHEIQQLYSDANRIWLKSSEIPDTMKDAIVSIEDERFYKHKGVDIKRTTGAVINWCLNKVGIKRSSYGGSTITQQVIKNITKDDKKSPDRKVREIMRAVALENELSKDEILTIYLNIVYFANKCYGVEAAANVYFDKTITELSLAETASIAGITQTPARFNPFEHPDNNVEKRNRVLSKMYELEKISEDEYNTATNEKLVTSTSHKEQKNRISSYFADQVINEVINDLQTKKGYSATFAEQQVFNGGLKIYTTMDKSIQDIMEGVFTNTANFPKISGKAQSAMIIIDPYTGEVKGLVGGLGEKTESRGLNRATQSKRQPGSSFKPVSVYAPALQEGKITAATSILDESITIGKWTPRNSYAGFKGDMLVKRAIEISANIPAVKVADKVGVDTSYNYLKDKFHISTLDERDKNLSSLGLGGLTYGVTVKELAAAYGVFMNNGVYIEPHIYTKVVDSTGKVIIEYKPEKTEVLKQGNAFIMTDMLKAVVNGSKGTARAAKLSKMPTYGKTGTTNDDYDKWFVGFTPYYVGAVWYGFDTPKSIKAAGVSYNPSVRVWKKVMDKVHSDLAVKDFTAPSDVVTASICSVTGKLASDKCESNKEYFIKGTQPKSVCSSAHGKGNDTGTEFNPEDSEIGTTVTPTPIPLETNDPNQTPKPSAGNGDDNVTPTKSPEPSKTQSPATPKPVETRAPEKTKAPSNDDVVIPID